MIAQADPAEETVAGLKTRQAAAAILGDVIDRQRALDQSFATRAADFSGADRGFLRMLAATALRRLGTIDAILEACLSASLPERHKAFRHALRIAATDILFLRTPAHAAVNTGVAMARTAVNSAGLIRLANAVLRRLSREGEALLAKVAVPEQNTPDWLLRRWQAHYDAETISAICAAHLREPPVALQFRHRPDEQTPDDRIAGLGGAPLPGGGVALFAAGPVADLPGYAEGAFWVQDPAAALPPRLLGVPDGAHVLDLCAAPGGKTLRLAADGARVTAIDRSAPRLRQLEENLARTGLSAEIICADAATYRPPAPVDFVLLDAPCSATGTLRRHPDVAYLKSETDIARLAEVQTRLLKAAADMLAPGGRLIYCVCSLEPEEGPAQIARALTDPTLRRQPIAAAEIPGFEAARDANGDLRTLPSHGAAFGGMDGFYIARLERTP